MQFPLVIQAHPVISAAVALGILGGVAGIGVASAAHDADPVQTAESARFSANADNAEAVEFWTSMCPALLDLKGTPDRFSEAVETGIGEAPDAQIALLSTALTDAAGRADSAVDALPGTAPAEVPPAPGSGSPRTVDYTPALDDVRRTLTDQSEKLRSAVDASSSNPDAAEVTRRLATAANSAGTSATDSINNLSSRAPLPNQKALDAMSSSTECKGITSTAPVAVDEVHTPQVELYTAMITARDAWADTLEKYSGSEIPADQLAGVYRDLASAAAAGRDAFDTWLSDNQDDPLEEDIPAAEDGHSVYATIADKAGAAAQALESGSGFDEAGQTQWVVDEAKFRVRFLRTDKPVNQVTAEALPNVS